MAADYKDLIKQLKEEAVAEKTAMREALIREFRESKIGLSNLDENLIKLLMAKSSSKPKPAIPETPEVGSGDSPASSEMGIDLTLSDIEVKVIDDLLNKNNVYLYGKAGTGKAQPMYSKILTPDGWKTMGEIKVGDKVMTENNSQTTVVGVFDRGERNVCRVFFNDGSYTDCCDEHLWKVQNSNDRSYGRSGTVTALKDIKLKRPNGRNDAYIPIVKPIDFPAKKHIVDAYVIGVILGDGGLTGESIKITKNDEELFEMVGAALPENLKLKKQGDKNVDTYIIGLKDDTGSNQHTGSKNQYKESLKEMGLMYEKSLDKFIPEQYKFDSLENRVKLFQGLNDTDGFVDKGQLQFSTSSERLKDDYVGLVQSFGGTCTVEPRTPFYTYNGEKKQGHQTYRIHVRIPNEIKPFRLKRKADLYVEKTKYFPYRYMEKIESIGTMPCRCIQVESESHLYVTDSYIVTHNTVMAKKVAEVLFKNKYISNPLKFYTLNCSQWTSPIQILGGWSIEGYKEGLATLAWKNGGVLILDELPKLDANTAGLLNDMLSSATEPNATIPDNSSDEMKKIPKHPQFFVIGTGNTDMKTTSMNFSGNNQQDYSLVDRFAGSMYYIDFDTEKELSLTPFPVYAIALAIRKFLETDVNSVESISLRTMLNFRRIYELEMLRDNFSDSPFLKNKDSFNQIQIEVLDDEGKPEIITSNVGKTLADSVYSFINSLPKTKRDNILNKKLASIGEFDDAELKQMLRMAKDDVQQFQTEFMRIHGRNPANGELVEIDIKDIDAVHAEKIANAKKKP